MERKYVRGLYDGQILTDFDEVTPRFEDVITLRGRVRTLELKRE